MDIQEILVHLVQQVSMTQLVGGHFNVQHAQLTAKLALLQFVLFVLMAISIAILVIPKLFAMAVLLLAIIK